MIKTLDEIPALSEELYNTVSSAIETITFLPVEMLRDTNNSPEKKGEYINGSILIKTAPAMYSLEMLVSQDFLENVSVDIAVSGTGAEEASNIVIDVLLELVNTISGSLMRTMEALTGPFTIEIPEFEVGTKLSKTAFIKQKYIVDNNYRISVAITKI